MKDLEKKFNQTELDLIRELKIYSKIYVNDLKALGHSNEVIIDSINNWIVGTFQYYKDNNMNLHDILNSYKYLNSNKPNATEINYNEEKDNNHVTTK